jgi:glycosyltransferase involved in cell wall biosynthesis
MSKVKYEKTIGIYFPTYGSGGARRHLTELLNRWDKYSEVKFIIFGPHELEKVIPNLSSISFQRVSALERGFVIRFLWELFLSYRLFSNLSVLFVPLGSYVGFFRPFVTMSRNLLLYDSKEIARMDLFSSKIATHFNRYIQLYTFYNASRIIFISEYAKEIICKIKNSFKLKSIVINHGVSTDFFYDDRVFLDISEYSRNNPFKILYVSSFYEYKNHRNLLECISRISDEYPIELILIGDFSSSKNQVEFSDLISEYNRIIGYEIIKCFQHLDLFEVGAYFKSSDMFVFPSSVENMPNVLIEAMASFLPIASSNVRPMPEFLCDCGLYFDPLSLDSMEYVIESFIKDKNLRKEFSLKARNRAMIYSWDVTSINTMNVILDKI